MLIFKYIIDHNSVLFPLFCIELRLRLTSSSGTTWGFEYNDISDDYHPDYGYLPTYGYDAVVAQNGDGRGRVEFYYDSEWHGICNDGSTWQKMESTVVCKQLGFPGVMYQFVSILYIVK